MRQPDARAFLFDIQMACQLVREFTSGMTFQDYAEDRKTLESDLPGLAARVEELLAKT